MISKGKKAYSRTPGVQEVHMGVRDYSGSTGVRREYSGSTAGVREYSGSTGVRWEYGSTGSKMGAHKKYNELF